MQIEGPFQLWCERCAGMVIRRDLDRVEPVDAPGPGTAIAFAFRCARPMIGNSTPCGFPIFTAGNAKGLARVALVRKD